MPKTDTNEIDLSKYNVNLTDTPDAPQNVDVTKGYYKAAVAKTVARLNKNELPMLEWNWKLKSKDPVVNGAIMKTFTNLVEGDSVYSLSGLKEHMIALGFPLKVNIAAMQKKLTGKEAILLVDKRPYTNKKGEEITVSSVVSLLPITAKVQLDAASTTAPKKKSGMVSEAEEDIDADEIPTAEEGEAEEGPVEEETPTEEEAVEDTVTDVIKRVDKKAKDGKPFVVFAATADGKTVGDEFRFKFEKNADAKVVELAGQYNLEMA